VLQQVELSLPIVSDFIRASSYGPRAIDKVASTVEQTKRAVEQGSEHELSAIRGPLAQALRLIIDICDLMYRSMPEQLPATQGT
ncbi:MAG: hypothetical protein AAFV29_05665, partial [Myxococcota bacterium]